MKTYTKMKTFKKIYVEITNKCNLSCSFCPGTKRPGKFLDAAEFSHILKEIKPHTDFIYFHLMGEPLLHPHFFEFIDMAAAEGLKVCITTNGTLLKKNEMQLLQRLAGSSAGSIHKISISIQAMEANSVCLDSPSSMRTDASNSASINQNSTKYDFSNYLQDCFEFGKFAEGKTIIAYRLWNEGGENKENGAIIELMHQYFTQEWVKDHNSYAIGNRIFLELGDKFDWPSPDADCIPKEEYYCYALKDQIGILSDGTVVPCCLDAEGQLSLGNIFETPLEEIINSPRAVSIKEAFKNRRAAEDLCKRCGYASRFTK